MQLHAIQTGGDEHRAALGLMGKLRGYLPHRWPDWFAPREIRWAAEPYGPFPESFALTRAGDVRVVRTPGHSAGHVSVIVEEAEGTVVFIAGDASYTEEHLSAGVVDGVSSMGAGEQAARVSMDRIRRLAATRHLIYLPSHDPQSAASLAWRQEVTRGAAVPPTIGARDGS